MDCVLVIYIVRELMGVPMPPHDPPWVVPSGIILAMLPEKMGITTNFGHFSKLFLVKESDKHMIQHGRPLLCVYQDKKHAKI